MKSITQRFVTLGSAAILALGLASAQAAGTNETRGSLDHVDYEFAVKATRGGMEEVKEGQLAVSKGASDTVKQLGQTMVTDHTKAGDALAAILTTKGATVAPKEPMMAEHEYTHLTKLTGSDFDKAYIKHQVTAHKMTVKEFEFASKHVTDPDLKNFAITTLPTLQQHLKMVEDAEASMKGK